jgi:hypothetical protein
MYHAAAVRQSRDQNRFATGCRFGPKRLSVSTETACRFEPKSPVGNSEICRLGIHYRIGNANQSGLPPQSIDLIISDVVLEYVSAEKLFEILQKFQRLAAPRR